MATSTMTTTTITSTTTTGATLVLSPVSGPTGTVVAATGSNYVGTACSLFSIPSGVGFFASPPSCAISGGILTGGFVVGASAPAGSYTVTVSSASPSSTAGATASATFTVTVPGTGYLSVNLDKWEYLTGLVVHISGDIYTPYCTWTYTNAGGLAVTLSISDSSGSVILTTTTDPNAAGYKNYAYDYALPANAYSGTYTVLVSYNACGSPVYGHGAFQVISEPPHHFVVNVDRTSYVCGSNVLVTGKLWAAMGKDVMIPGATVIFEIHTPSGSVLASGSSTTDSLGIATFRFTLPSTCETGTYVAFASSTHASIVYGGPDVHLTTSTNFPVSGPVTGRTHVTITLSTTDSNGNPKSAFTRGETVLVKVQVNNDGTFSLDNIHILLTIYDPNNVPIFFGISIISLNQGQQQTQLLGLPLGSTLPAGSFRGEIVVLTAFLASGGHYVPDGSGAVTFVVT